MLSFKHLFKKNIRFIIGAAAGGGLGFAYYYFIGCAAGGCIITSNPFVSVLYGAVTGLLCASALGRRKPPEEKKSDS